MNWALRFVLFFTAVVLAFGASLTANLQPGKANLQSAGPLAFGPEGILFVGDYKAAAVVALATNDNKVAATAVEVQGLHEKVAALLGTTPDQILVNDMVVHPISKRAYLSVSRGRGPDALPVIVRTAAGGKVEEFALDNVRHARAELPNAPSAEAKDRRGQSLRLEAITDLAWVEGKVLVAGLSNEEFASTLRSIPFPFSSQVTSTSVEIYHGSHGRFETNAPVRTFTSYKLKNQPHLLAAYTCTPLVTIPLSDLQPGKKVQGTTIAELGNRNRPLDMVVYQKGGANYILMNNSSRGVMKLPADNLEKFPGITKPTEMQGVPYETIATLKGVEQLDRLDDTRAVLLVKSEGGALDLKTIALP